MSNKDFSDLGKREKAILKYIEKQIIANSYPPSVREIGKAIGLSSTATVHGYIEKLEKKGYIKKETQKGRTLRLIKGILGKDKNSEEKISRSVKEIVEVPIIREITAGNSILAAENIVDTFPVTSDFVENNECFILIVKGESMIKAGIFDGDYILVKKQNTASNGEFVVALIEDEATVRTFYKEKDHIRLQPENIIMEPIIISDCVILGKVVGVFRKIK